MIKINTFPRLENPIRLMIDLHTVCSPCPPTDVQGGRGCGIYVFFGAALRGRYVRLRTIHWVRRYSRAHADTGVLANRVLNHLIGFSRYDGPRIESVMPCVSTCGNYINL